MKYSLGGYVAALTARTSKTLLVEGSSDRKFFSRILLQMDPGALRGPVCVDTAELISGPTGVSGNRQIVEAVHARVAGGSAAFFAVVDREFREFHLGPPIRDNLLRPKMDGASLMWTRGHSIENYGFVGEYVETYLKLMFPEHVTAEQIAGVGLYLDDILEWCACWSVACHRSGILERAERLLDVPHWIVAAPNSARIDLDRLIPSIMARGATQPVAEQACLDCSAWHAASVSDPRWVAHGHISLHALWPAIAAVLQSFSVPAHVVTSVAYSDFEVKMRSLAEAIANVLRSEPSLVAPELLAWLAA